MEKGRRYIAMGISMLELGSMTLVVVLASSNTLMETCLKAIGTSTIGRVLAEWHLPAERSNEASGTLIRSTANLSSKMQMAKEKCKNGIAKRAL